MTAENQVLELLDSPKLISRKIRMTEKSSKWGAQVCNIIFQIKDHTVLQT